MTNLVIDINARFIPNERRVWRMFPGERYRFLSSFLKSGIVFLEMPGLELPNGLITEGTPQLRELLHLSREIEKWIAAYRRHLRAGTAEDPPPKPTRDLSAFAGRALSRDQQNVLGAVRNLFGTASKGDLVVVPDQIPTREVLIGEFLEGPETRSIHSPDFFSGEFTPARPVRWFPAVDELRLPRELSNTLRIPPAFSQIPRPFVTSILENSYGTYYRAEEYCARILINGREFDTQNTFDLSSIAQFASVICSVLTESSASVSAALANYADKITSPEFQPAVSLNINSPGTGSLKAATFVPIFFAAWFALTATADAKSRPAASDVTVINSVEGEGDPCAAKVSEAVRETLKLIGFDQWESLCLRAERLRKSAQTNVDSHVKERK